MYEKKQCYRSTSALIFGLALLASSTEAVAKPPQGKGGKDSLPNCILFAGAPDSVQGDNLGNEYCEVKWVEVSFTQPPHHLRLTTSTKSGQGREIYVKFGTTVTLANGYEIDDTADSRVIETTASMAVGWWQADFDFFDPNGDGVLEPGESNVNPVNLLLRVSLALSDGTTDSLLMRLSPNPTGGARYCPSSDPVAVTYNGIDGGGKHNWTVATTSLDQGAGISRSGEGEFSDTNLLTDVQGDGLMAGHIPLNFSFTVTASAE